MRLLLAIRAFFRILFGRPLPPEVLVLPPYAITPTPTAEGGAHGEAVAPPPSPSATATAAATATEKAPALSTEAIAVRALSIFQSEGRLLDFLLEDIDGYKDDEIGAAVREIHRGCRRALQDHFKVAPVRAEAEDSRITVPEGYDPAEIRLVGNVVGRPPFSGTLKHRGWRVEEVRLPTIPEGKGARVIAPAEVELP